MKFSKHTQIPQSATMAMNDLALEKKKAGEKVYNLTAGEPMLDVSSVVSDATIEAIRQGKIHYAPVAGIPELRDSAVEWMNRSFHSSFEQKNVIVTCGGKSALQMLAHAFIEEGDEAIIAAPYWVSYPSMVRLFGGESRIVYTSEEKGWKASVEQIKDKITSRTKILFLNNASNPTGTLYTREELYEIVKIAHESNVVVVSDEVYSGLVYDGHEYISCASFQEFKDNVIVVQSASKNFAITGWRVGFAFGPEEVIKKLSTIQSQSTSGTSSISQWAAVAAFKNADEIISMINHEMRKRRDVFVDTFNKLFNAGIKAPASALYCFIPLKAFGVEETDSMAFCMMVLEKGNVAMVPGVAFEAEGYVRCSFGSEEREIIESLEALHSFLNK